VHVVSAVTLGLIAAPDIPEKIARELASELPDLLASRVDDSVSWEVTVVVDPLTGTDREAPEKILDACRQRRLGEGWNLGLCITDLPVYRSGRLVAADVSAKRGVAGPSLAAMGAMRLGTRARELTLQLARELYERTKEPGGGGGEGVVPPERVYTALVSQAGRARNGLCVLAPCPLYE
jgi:hypothetical protein